MSKQAFNGTLALALATLSAGLGLSTWKMLSFHERLMAIEDNARREVHLRPVEGGVLLFGDSQIARWPMTQSFGQLPIWNRGVAGDLAQDAGARFTRAVRDVRPGLTVLLIGTNDLGNGKSLESTQAHIDGMLRQVEGHAIVCSLLPASGEYASNHPRAALAQWNARLRQLAASHGDQFINLYAVLADERGAFRAQLTADGLHPNAAGYEVMTQLLLSRLYPTEINHADTRVPDLRQVGVGPRAVAR